MAIREGLATDEGNGGEVESPRCASYSRPGECRLDAAVVWLIIPYTAQLSYLMLLFG